MMTVDCLEEAGRSLSRLVRDADKSALELLLSAKPNVNSATYPSNAWYALRNWDTLMYYMSATERQKIGEELKDFDGLIDKINVPMNRSQIQELAEAGGHGSAYLVGKHWDEIEARLVRTKNRCFHKPIQ